MNINVLNEKAYPMADTWMWNYCTYLGTVELNGKMYDLGFYSGDMFYYAIVYGNEQGEYISGEMNHKTEIEIKKITNNLFIEYFFK